MFNNRRNNRMMFSRENRKKVIFKRILIAFVSITAVLIVASFFNENIGNAIINKIVFVFKQEEIKPQSTPNAIEIANKKALMEKEIKEKELKRKNELIAAENLKKKLLEEQNILVKPEAVTEHYNQLETNLTNLLANYSGKYGVYYYDLVSGNHFGINHKDEFIAASTVKVLLNIYLCREVEKGNIKLDEEMAYLEEDYETGTGAIRYKEFGEKFKISRLSELAITFSDNVATNMLIRRLGRANFKNFMRECGGTYVIDDVNISSPFDMGIYLKKLHDFYKNGEKSSIKLIMDMQNTEYNTRIPSKLPKDVKISHKIGSQVRIVNDVGIVFTNRPYIICVMSKKVDENKADEAIANISEMIYNFNISSKD